MADIPVAYLREAFSYDPKTGVLAWRMRPREHFKSDHDWKVFNKRFPGREAGVRNSEGYRQLGLSFGGVYFQLRGHRVAWTIAKGAWPTNEVDHRNGICDDNRLKNLREATDVEQPQNRKLNKRNTSGFPGVFKRDKKWGAQIGVSNRLLV
jgi:hypothetical protein